MRVSVDQLMLKLPSNTRNVAAVESFVNRIVEHYRISPDLHCNILVSLTEAVTNAIIHGNSQDESKNVSIELKKQRDTLAIQVSDEGRGFDPKRLPDPTSPENIHNCGGRGVFLIHQLSHAVRFHNNGSTVEMQFKIV